MFNSHIQNTLLSDIQDKLSVFNQPKLTFQLFIIIQIVMNNIF